MYGQEQEVKVCRIEQTPVSPVFSILIGKGERENRWAAQSTSITPLAVASGPHLG
jgi:hypothetical protein